MIFTQTNDADRNAVVAYDDALMPLGSVPTGGRGTGEPHLPSQGSVAADGDRLLVANAGSGDVSVFSLSGDEPELLAVVPTGGGRPARGPCRTCRPRAPRAWPVRRAQAASQVCR